MLQNIRNNIQGTMAKVIIAIIIVPFAIFGIESLVGGGDAAPAAEVNGEKISENDLRQGVEIEKRRLLAMMGDNIQPGMLDDAALRGPTLDSLITQRVLQQGAGELGLGVSAQSVATAIGGMEAFQQDGKFSPERYQTLLQSRGYTPVYFRHMLQQELLVNQLHSGITDSEFVTADELKRVADLLQQQRTFSYATIPVAGLQDQVTVGDSDIETYYNANKDRFLSEERIKPEYIELRAADFIQPVDDAALRAEYEREMAVFKADTERHVAHIEIATNAQRNAEQARALADSIRAKLEAGEDFAALAAQYSDDLGSKSSGGDLGTSTGDTFPAAFEQALSSLKVGEVSAPVQSGDSYHLIKLIAADVKERPTFEQRKAAIEQRLQMAKAQPELLKTVEKLRDQVFNSDGLKGPAETLKLQLREGDWFDRKIATGVFANPKVLNAAFAPDVVKDGNNSDVIEIEPDHFIVLRAKQYEAAAPKPLEQVRVEIATVLRQERAQAAAQAKAREIAKSAESEGLEKAASQQGYTAKTVEKTTRGNSVAPADLVRAAFGMPRPTSGQALPVQTVALDDGDVALVQLQDVVESASDSINPAQRDALVAQLQQGFGAAAFAALMENLRQRAEIKRN